MQYFEFIMILDRVLTGDEINALYEAGFDSSTLGSEQDKGYIDTAWKASTKEAAIEEATIALRQTVPDIQIIRIENVPVV